MKERLLEKVYEHGDIVCGDDGYYIFWPTRNHGALDAESLRIIADHLDEKNEEWDKAVYDYFEKQGAVNG